MRSFENTSLRYQGCELFLVEVQENEVYKSVQVPSRILGIIHAVADLRNYKSPTNDMELVHSPHPNEIVHGNFLEVSMYHFHIWSWWRYR